jgi:hypothetical protein
MSTAGSLLVVLHGHSAHPLGDLRPGKGGVLKSRAVPKMLLGKSRDLTYIMHVLKNQPAFQ